MTHADIKQCLDRCGDCGAPAGYELQYGNGLIRARCTECNNTGDWNKMKWETIVPWNLEQRKMKTQSVERRAK